MAENGDNASLIELEFDDIDGRNTDIEVGSYLVNRIISGEYRDAERAVDCDVFETSAEPNTTRRENE